MSSCVTVLFACSLLRCFHRNFAYFCLIKTSVLFNLLCVLIRFYTDIGSVGREWGSDVPNRLFMKRVGHTHPPRPLSLCVSVCLSLSLCLSLCLSVSVCLPACLPACLCLCQSVSVSLHPSPGGFTLFKSLPYLNLTPQQLITCSYVLIPLLPSPLLHHIP